MLEQIERDIKTLTVAKYDVLISLARVPGDAALGQRIAEINAELEILRSIRAVKGCA